MCAPRLLHQARRAVMQEEADGGKRSVSPGKSVGRGETHRTAPLVSGTIDIEKVKKRQQKEIESMMAYEMKMQEVAEEQERRQVRACGCVVLFYRLLVFGCPQLLVYHGVSKEQMGGRLVLQCWMCDE